MYTKSEAQYAAQHMGEGAEIEQMGGGVHAVIVRGNNIVVAVVVEGSAPELAVYTTQSWESVENISTEPFEIETLPNMAGGALPLEDGSGFADPDLPGHDERWWAALGESARATAAYYGGTR